MLISGDLQAIKKNDAMYIPKITNGRVELYDERGCYQRYIVHSDAVSARWAGSDIAVTDKQGRVKIYDERGCYKRTI